MVQLEMIDSIAQVRRREIDREVFGAYRVRRYFPRTVPQRRTHLDLNIRIVLQPRLSLSIWFGRGA